MNPNQFKKITIFKNLFNYIGQIIALSIAMLVSIIGRSGITIFLAAANGFMGSLAFADLSSNRFLNYVLSDSPDISMVMAKHEAHSAAHWVGLFVMIALDVCIFIYGFVRPKKNEKGELIDLEPRSRDMAIFSAALGAAGFLAGMIGEPIASWGLIQWLEISFMVMISSVAPLLLFINTKYQKAEDGPIIYAIIDKCMEELKASLSDFSFKPQNSIPQKPKQPAQKITTSDGVPFDIDQFLKSN